MQGQSATAKKVYEAIPITEAWSFTQIFAEVNRRGVGIQYNIFQGCVQNLKEAGLVVEPKVGHFLRATLRTPAPAEPIELPSAKHYIPKTIEVRHVAQPISTPPTPLDKLANLAQRMRVIGETADRLAHEAGKLADDLDNAAIEIEDGSGPEKEELLRLRKFRDALKSLSE